MRRVLTRSIGFAAVVAVLTGMVARIEVATTEATLLSARDVRTVDTADLGVPSPRGITFMPGDGSLLVQGEGTTLLHMTTGGDRVGFTTGGAWPGAHASDLTARHPATGRQYVLSPDDDLLLERDADGTPHATYRLADLDLVDPRGMTFAPSADKTDDPTEQHLYIADAGDGVSAGGITEVSLEPGLTLAATPPVVTAQLVRTIDTSQFSPASPDPAGIVHLPGTDRMQIVDSEVDETTGVGYHNVNLWQVTRTGSVTDTGSTWTGGAGYSREPTGLGFIPATNTLLVSDDTADRVWLDRPGLDGRHGTADDALSWINAGAYGSDDTEDPEYDPATGHIFFIDGTNLEVYEVDPVNGVFGDGNDVMTHFDTAKDGMRDTEGLSSDPGRGTLLVGDRNLRQIFEYTKTGELVRIINASGISSMRYLSGLAYGPASDGSGSNNYWTVDRAVDNGASSSENDGRIFELRINTPAGSPLAVADTATTAEDTAVSVNVAANDTDPDNNLNPASVTVTAQPANGTATPNGNGTVTYTPATNFNGSNSFTYQICDTTSLCATATAAVTVTAVADPPVANADTASTNTDSPVIVNVAANDTDPDGNLDPASVTVTAQPANGTATPNGNGTVTYTPATSYQGPDAFTYQVCDTTSLCATANATMAVSDLPDPPVANADTETTAEDTAVSVNVAANDTDPDGNLESGQRHGHRPAGQRHRHPQRERHRHLHTRHELQRQQQLHLPNLRHHQPLRDGHRHRHRDRGR